VGNPEPLSVALYDLDLLVIRDFPALVAFQATLTELYGCSLGKENRCLFAMASFMSRRISEPSCSPWLSTLTPVSLTL
jgi:hypothetical protein